jgi:hypothetical protein
VRVAAIDAVVDGASTVDTVGQCADGAVTRAGRRDDPVNDPVTAAAPPRTPFRGIDARCNRERRDKKTAPVGFCDDNPVADETMQFRPEREFRMSKTKGFRGWGHRLKDIPVQLVCREKECPRGGGGSRGKQVFSMLRVCQRIWRGAQCPTKAWDGSPIGCHNPAGRYYGIPRPLVCVAARRETKKVIAREDGYPFIADLSSLDLRHRERRRRHLCVQYGSRSCQQPHLPGHI